MNAYIIDAFNQQTNGARLLRIFEDMASTIVFEYWQEVDDFITQHGYAPSFTELFQRFRDLNTDLNTKASLILKDYRETKGHKSIRLTTGCKRIIKNSINDFLKQVKALLYQKGFSEMAGLDISFKDL